MPKTWKAKLRTGSFRGVQFFIDTSNYGGGRRGVTHEFAGRDIGYREDLGRKIRTYKVDAYVLGASYTSDRDKLISALEQFGSGKLVHPYYGTVTVCVEGDFSVQESTKEGGFAKISIPFVEAGSPAFPTAGSDTAGLLGSSADGVDAANASFLSKALNVITQPQFVIDSVSDKVNGFADALDSSSAQVSGTANSIANLAFAIRDLKQSVKVILGTPAKLAEQMQSAMGFLVGALNPSDVIAAAHNMFNFGDSDQPVPPTTTSRVNQARALTALNTFVQVGMVSTAAKVVAQNKYASSNDAIATRDSINSQIDKLLEAVSDDGIYNALQDLQAKVTQAVPQPGQDLPSLDDITIQTETNVLAFCYDLYGSLDLEDDILARNNVIHPGFLPPGQSLEVIDANAG